MVKGWRRDLLAILVVFLGVQLWQTRHLLPTGDHTTAPTFRLNTLDGGAGELGGPSSAATLVYFWAPWCGVCGVTASNVAAAARWLDADRIRVVTVALAYEDQAAVARYIAEHRLEIPTLLGDDAVMEAYRVQAFPTFYWINRQGEVVGHAVGYTTRVGLWLRSLRLLWG